MTISNSTHQPENPKIATIVAQGQVTQGARKLEMGAMGRFLGGSEKPGNIACLVIAVFMTTWVIVAIWGTDGPTLTKKELLGLTGSFITLALGYLFGRASRG